jgi:hypothetical protein
MLKLKKIRRSRGRLKGVFKNFRGRGGCASKTETKRRLPADAKKKYHIFCQ